MTDPPFPFRENVSPKPTCCHSLVLLYIIGDGCGFVLAEVLHSVFRD